MKSSISLLVLTSFCSVAAFAQFHSGRREPESPGHDNLSAIGELERASSDSEWPHQGAVRDWNDNGTASTVSLKELQHKIPKAATKEYTKGTQALVKGHLALAKEHLQTAINIDPDFADAHNNLGFVMAQIGQSSESVSEFQKAVELSPRNTEALSNLTVSLYRQRRYDAACQVARQSLNVDSSLTQVRFVLALSLIAADGDRKEALANLNRAAREYPEAHLAASDLLLRMDQPNEAAQHLEAYLQSAQADAPSRGRIEAWLAQIRP